MLRTLLAVAFFLPATAFANPSNVNVKINGMTCDACTQMVKSKISKIPNVEASKVTVTLKEKRAVVAVADATPQMIAAIKQAVVDAGYKVDGEPTVTAVKN